MSFLSFLQGVEHNVQNAVTPKAKSQPQKNQKQPTGNNFLHFLSQAATDVGDAIIPGGTKGPVQDLAVKPAQGPAARAISTVSQKPAKVGGESRLPANQEIKDAKGFKGKALATLGVAADAASLIPAGAEAGPAIRTGTKLALEDARAGFPTVANETGAVGKNVLDLKAPKKVPPVTKQGAPTVAEPGAKTNSGAILQDAEKYGIKIPDEIKTAIDKHDLAGTKPVPFASLKNFRNTTNVAATYKGEIGANTVHELAKGYKTQSDLQEYFQPAIKDAQEALKKVAKTKVGGQDVQARIFKALHDPENVHNYLKTPEEMSAFDKVNKLINVDVRGLREQNGLSVKEGYGATHTTDLVGPQEGGATIAQARSKGPQDVQAASSKFRESNEVKDDLNTNVIDTLPRYIASQVKEIAYTPAVKYYQENGSKVHPSFTANSQDAHTGDQYFRQLFQQVLSPTPKSSGERFANKLIGNVYSNQLKLNPRFAATNAGQTILTNASREGKQVAKGFTKEHQNDLLSGLNSSKYAYTGEADAITDKVAGKTNVAGKAVDAIDPGQKVETRNINKSYLQGAGQAVADSKVYKDLRASGMSKNEAISEALKDAKVKQEAVRGGNNNVQDNQFAQNFAEKPAVFRAQGGIGAATNFAAQYLRFPTGVAENLISRVATPRTAREVDLLKSGNVDKISLVHFKRTVEALHNGVDELLKASKAGELQGVHPEDVKATQQLLKSSLKEANKQIKGASSLSAGKSIRQFTKLYLYGLAVQSLFVGGLNAKSAQSALPFNTPQYGESVLDTLAPSVPFIHGETPSQNASKVANFIPGVGLAYNTGKRVNQYANTLAGGK